MLEFIERDVPQLTAVIYEAALNPNQWHTVLDRLGASLGDVHVAQYWYADRSASRPASALLSGTEPRFIESFDSHYGPINPYPQLAFFSCAPGAVVLATDVVPESDAIKTEFVNDWLRPQGRGPNHFGAVLYNGPTTQVLLALLPPERVAKRSLKTMARKFELLTPHLMRALEINLRLAVTEQWQSLTNATFETFGAAAMLVDQSARVHRMTPAAEALLRKAGRAIAVDRHGTLRAADAAADNVLSGAIARGCATGCPTGPIRVAAHLPGQGVLAWIIASPSAKGMVTEARLASLAPPALVLVLLTPIERAPAIPPEVIATAFQLSPAEARLVSGLIGGLTLEVYAARHGLSRNTARNQLSSAFERTGTARQADLVARVVATLGPAMR